MYRLNRKLIPKFGKHSAKGISKSLGSVLVSLLEQMTLVDFCLISSYSRLNCLKRQSKDSRRKTWERLEVLGKQ